MLSWESKCCPSSVYLSLSCIAANLAVGSVTRDWFNIGTIGERNIIYCSYTIWLFLKKTNFLLCFQVWTVFSKGDSLIHFFDSTFTPFETDKNISVNPSYNSTCLFCLPPWYLSIYVRWEMFPFWTLLWVHSEEQLLLEKNSWVLSQEWKFVGFSIWAISADRQRVSCRKLSCI